MWCLAPPSLTVWPWAIAFLCLSGFSGKMRMFVISLPPFLWGSHEITRLGDRGGYVTNSKHSIIAVISFVLEVLRLPHTMLYDLLPVNRIYVSFLRHLFNSAGMRCPSNTVLIDPDYDPGFWDGHASSYLSFTLAASLPSLPLSLGPASTSSFCLPSNPVDDRFGFVLDIYNLRNSSLSVLNHWILSRPRKHKRA